MKKKVKQKEIIIIGLNETILDLKEKLQILSNKNTQQQKEIDNYINTISKQNDQATKLNKTVKQFDKLNVELDEKQQEIKGLHEQHDELIKQINTLNEKEGKTSDQLNQIITELNTECDELKKQVKEYKGWKDDSISYSIENERLRKTLGECIQQIKKLKVYENKSSENEKKYNKIKEQLTQTTKEMNQMKIKSKHDDIAKDKLEIEIKENDKTIAALTTQTNQLKIEIKDLKQKINKQDVEHEEQIVTLKTQLMEEQQEQQQQEVQKVNIKWRKHMKQLKAFHALKIDNFAIWRRINCDLPDEHPWVINQVIDKKFAEDSSCMDIFSRIYTLEPSSDDAFTLSFINTFGALKYLFCNVWDDKIKDKLPRSRSHTGWMEDLMELAYSIDKIFDLQFDYSNVY